MDPHIDLLRAFLKRIVEGQRRQAGMEMRGKITAVDPEKGTARIEIGKDDEGNPVQSPWLPYRQIAGSLKVHHAPTVGQSMSMRSENGDINQGVLEPFTWSDDNPANSTSGDSTVISLGAVTVTMSPDGINIDVGGTTYALTSSGFEQTGGHQRHNGVNVGSTHIHGGVFPGGSDTEPPSN